MKKSKNEKVIESLGKTRGVASIIIDVFEKLLEDNNISIPDVERIGAESESCIYGETYYQLEDEITEILYDFIDE